MGGKAARSSTGYLQSCLERTIDKRRTVGSSKVEKEQKRKGEQGNSAEGCRGKNRTNKRRLAVFDGGPL